MLDHLFTNYTTMFVRNTTKVVLLTAPIANVTLYGGKAVTSWFDIVTNNVSKEIDFVHAYNISDMINSSHTVKQVMYEEINVLKGDSTKLFIGGFSQGCFMSWYTGLTFDKPLGGIMASSGYLISVPEMELNGANVNVPLYISHGKKDATVLFGVAEQVYQDRLSPFAHKITKVYEDNAGHAITETMKVRQRQWFFDQTQPKKEQEKLFLPILF